MARLGSAQDDLQSHLARITELASRSLPECRTSQGTVKTVVAGTTQQPAADIATGLGMAGSELPLLSTQQWPQQTRPDILHVLQALASNQVQAGAMAQSQAAASQANNQTNFGWV